MQHRIDDFIKFLAIERGLSEAYQLSVHQTLQSLADWMDQRKLAINEIGTDELSEFLNQRKAEGHPLPAED